jgi:putative FmdB family regulatory protein
MPLYDWKCGHCAAAREVLRPMKEALIPLMCECGVPMTQQLSAAHVQPDISPYQAVTGDRAGKYITSRRAHREFLKRNRLIEVGNSPPADTRKFRSVTNRHEIREQMRPIVRDALRHDQRRKS